MTTVNDGLALYLHSKFSSIIGRDVLYQHGAHLRMTYGAGLCSIRMVHNE